MVDFTDSSVRAHFRACTRAEICVWINFSSSLQDYERMNVADALIPKIFYWDFFTVFRLFLTVILTVFLVFFFAGLWKDECGRCTHPQNIRFRRGHCQAGWCSPWNVLPWGWNLWSLCRKWERQPKKGNFILFFKIGPGLIWAWFWFVKSLLKVGEATEKR